MTKEISVHKNKKRGTKDSLWRPPTLKVWGEEKESAKETENEETVRQMENLVTMLSWKSKEKVFQEERKNALLLCQMLLMG